MADGRIQIRGLWGILGQVILLAGVCLVVSCEHDSKPLEVIAHQAPTEEKDIPENISRQRPRSEEYQKERERMVEVIKGRYDLDDTRSLDAISNVPRHWFVPEELRAYAYSDRPLPIGYDQTISQPFIVAYMTSLLELDENKKVLEIGTGSGYQAAVLYEFTPHVYSIEIVEPLGRAAKKTLHDRGYLTVEVAIGDGYKGWPEHAPFDAIIVTCAPEHIPPALLEQLRPGGRMVIPVGGVYEVQELVLVTKDEKGGIRKQSRMPVRFVPLVREGEE